MAVVAFGLLVLSPALGAQFVLVDDHEIISLTPPIGSSVRPAPIDVRGMALESDPAVGRFRPLYWTVRLNEVLAFGADPGAWHATMLVIGLVSGLLLFGTARTLGASELESALLGMWVLVAPGVSSLWVRLGADDTLATLFLCASAFACARAARRGGLFWELVFVLAAAAMCLSKEAFALTTPALAGLRVFAGGRTLRPRPRPTWSAVVVFLLGVLETLVVFAIGARAGPLSYGGRYLAVPAVGEYARALVQNAAILAFVGLGWLGLLVVVLRRDLLRNQVWIGATILMLVLVGPQLVLYSQQGIFEGKYEGAAATGLAGWSMLGLALLRRRCSRRLSLGRGCSRRLYRGGLSVWGFAVALFGFSTWTYANAFTQDSLQLGRMVDAVAASAAPGATVGIAADPARQYEPIESLADHIAHRGRGDLQLRVLPLAPSRPYTPLEASFGQALADSKFEQPPISDCAGVSAVIVLGDEQQTLQMLPCLTSGFQRQDFSSNVLLWGGDAVSLRPRLPGLVRQGYLVYRTIR